MWWGRGVGGGEEVYGCVYGSGHDRIAVRIPGRKKRRMEKRKTHPFEVDMSKSGVGACRSALSPVLCSPTSTLMGALEVLSSRLVEALNVPCIAPFFVMKLP